MKLNTKRTVLVSFAFFITLMFWQAYDTIMPITLTNKFGLDQFWSGVIMALDNIFALFMLPLFGSLSDKTKTKLGKRTPYILGGTVLSCVAILVLAFIDKLQYDLVMAQYKIQYELVADLYAKAKESNVGSDIIAAQEALEALNKEVGQAITAKNIGILIAFAFTLLIVLFAMSSFRSAAVALMPDITPKPLRSKGNAVVNLIGYVGGILATGLMMVFGADSTYVMDYRIFFVCLVVLMLGALAVHMVFVKENKWAEEELARAAEEDPVEQTAASETARGLSKGEKWSFWLLLASVGLWWMGYNAVATKFSVYSLNVLNKGSGIAMLIGTVAAIISFIPVGILSGKLGRKKTVMLGVAILFVAFTAFCFVTPNTNGIISIILFSLAGIGWATININSFPMVVELASHSNVGKYTGYYYTASMLAQVCTPLLSGFLMDNVSMRVLFPYSAICVALSFVTMLFVKHGDTKLNVDLKKSEDVQEHMSELLDYMDQEA